LPYCAASADDSIAISPRDFLFFDCKQTGIMDRARSDPDGLWKRLRSVDADGRDIGGAAAVIFRTPNRWALAFLRSRNHHPSQAARSR